jgi:hypothetical protein
LRSIALLAVTACGAAAAPPAVPVANRAPAPPRVELPVVFVHACLDRDMTSASVTWPAAERPGSLFVLVDERGYLATARISNRTHDCDDCDGSTVDADVVDRAKDLQPRCSYALGPVAAPRPRARAVSAHIDVSIAHDVTPWLAQTDIDLDGDGRPDFTDVARCVHVVRTGCTASVCDRMCEGLRRFGQAEPQRGSVHCSSLLPDVDDCPP